MKGQHHRSLDRPVGKQEHPHGGDGRRRPAAGVACGARLADSA